MTESEWLDVCALWADVWPNRTLPRSSIGTWYSLLADVDGQQVFAALTVWANDPDRSWPPQSPGEIRSAIEEPDEGWTEAIGKLALLVRRNGRYVPRPEIDDPALDAYVDSMGGWVALCSSFDPTDPTQRAQFRDHYQTVKKRERKTRSMELGQGILPAIGRGDDG